MKQTSFASAEYAGKKRKTRRERFLAEVDKVVPWARLEALIEPHYPKSGKVGRPPIGVPRKLRMKPAAAQGRQAISWQSPGPTIVVAEQHPEL